MLYRIGMVAVLLLAAFLRFYALDQSSLWSDEGNTWASSHPNCDSPLRILTRPR